MLVAQGKILIGCLNKGDDLLKALTDICNQENIRLGEFSLVGALKGVFMGYYLQAEQKYVTCVELKDTLEIASCIGNVSLKEGEIFVHVHIVVADHNGVCYGGHLMEGSEVFAAEYVVRELTGIDLNRVLDDETGLSLWKK